MKDVILLVSSIIGEIFLGYLAAIIAFFVWSLIKEGLGNPKQLAVPALILLIWFGIGWADGLSVSELASVSGNNNYVYSWCSLDIQARVGCK